MVVFVTNRFDADRSTTSLEEGGRDMSTKQDPTEARTQHHRVTVRRVQKGPVLGMHHKSKVTQAGKTANFEVSYLTRIGQQGAALAQAILQTCERDYATLQEVFGGLTPQNLPFAVQITADS